MTRGRLYLIPTYLDTSNEPTVIPEDVKTIIKALSHFVVENVRTARRFVSSLRLGLTIEELHFALLDKHSDTQAIDTLLAPLLQGQSVGLMSEAGLPCLADPGNLAVAWAHRQQIEVVPLVGASSIQLALIASGFNGQQFSFHGYLPIDKKERAAKLRKLEREMTKTGYTQLFMETPFRNNQLLASIYEQLNPDTLLSVSTNLTGAQERIRTQSVREWKKESPDLHKAPSIFSLGRFLN